ncbi:hypothetical protein ZIOFF_007834 [Zingiber officinale]|uniref:Reverse transcriptase Ty1/copia-type domain-containing protein n=1 Tax=Zingiber officinale TaxID=94328 RepID=A0A8J5IEG4_ZINOF|nr:hypothetical protein ZIOFF_007834 [Zingiber officinale]
MFGEFKEAMTKEFEMTDIELMVYYLRIEVNQRENGIFISQAGYAREILKKFKMNNRYSDSDWGGDMGDRKSTTRYVFFMGDTAFTWMLKKQPIVTLSTCEAEYTILFCTTMEVAALPGLLLKPFRTCPNSPSRNASFLDSALYFYVDTDASTTEAIELKDNYGGNDFEFEASICLGQQQQQLLSFADELFQSGKLLPLKLPPRLQTITGRNCRRSSSCATSPTLLSGATFRNPFVRGRHSSKCKDVDPFMVALEKVRKEDTTRGRDPPVRRARSLSPLRKPAAGWLQEQTIGTKKGDPGVNTQPSMKQTGMHTTEVSREIVGNTDSFCRRSNRKVKYKNILLAWSEDLRKANGGKWKIWLKEVFMCFGNNL